MAKKKIARAMSPNQLKKLTDTTTQSLSQMTTKELSKRVIALRKEAGRRIDTLEQASKTGLYSQAYESWKDNDNLLRHKRGKMTRQELQSQFTDLRNFLSDKSSTVTGAKRVRKERNEMIGGRLPKQYEKIYWDSWERFKETAGNYKKYTAKDDLQTLRSIVMSSKPKNGDDSTFLEIIKELKGEQGRKYEEKEQKRRERERANTFSPIRDEY